MARHIGLIGAPSSAGAFAPGQEKAPGALRQAGLAELLGAAGNTVSDLGDVPSFRWRPDPESPWAMNVDAVVSTALAVAERVEAAMGEGMVPLVLGGDCTVELGTVLGASRLEERVRLVYFDPHPDMNTPADCPDGALDWTGVAHMLDLPGSVGSIAGLGRRPLLAPHDLVLLDHSAERSRPAELSAVELGSIATVPERVVAADPESAATLALTPIGHGFERFLVHFDADAIDFADLPIAENTDRNVGLTLDQAARALATLTAVEGFAGLTITEVNPDHGSPDGETLRRFASRIAGALSS